MFTLIVPLLVMLLAFPVVNCGNWHIHWQNVSRSTDVTITAEQAGNFDGVQKLYVCRVFADNRLISGWFQFTKHGFSGCAVPIYGDEFHGNNFQALISLPGTTKWTNMSEGLPSNPVLGGNHRDGSKGYVCRAPYGNSIPLGISGGGGVPCFMTQGGREVQVHSANQIEILALADGIMMDPGFSRGGQHSGNKIIVTFVCFIMFYSR